MIDFPSTANSVIGQEFYTGDKKYTWDGVKWKVSVITPDWIRPSDWLPMPAMLATEQKFVGLHAVFPHDGGFENSSNFVAIQVQSNVAGVNNISIDWGDGVTELVAHNTVAQHIYNYNDISSTTDCSRGYRQARIVVTPVGVNLTAIYLNVRHSTLSQQVNSNWLDILCSLPNATGFTIGANGSMPAPARILENVNILSLGAVTSYQGWFANGLNALRVVTMPVSVPTLTETRYMFYACISLTTVNLFDTSKVIDCSAMFSTCRSLRTVPNFDIGRATLMGSMFFNCTLLTSIPLLNISANTVLPINPNGMFLGCSTLTEIPFLNFSNSTTFASLFSGCSLLRTIPAIDTSKGTFFDNMFVDCYDLISIPYLDTSKGTSFTRFAQAATSLQTSTPLDFTNSVPGGPLQIFNNVNTLADVTITNCKYTFSVSSCKLSQNTLTKIMNNLPPLPTKIASIAGTGVASNSIITLVGHGFANTAPIVFKSNGSTTGINIGTTYYTNNTTIDTFQVSAASGGALLALTNNSSNAIVSLSSSISLGGNPGTGGIYSYTNCNTTLGSKTITITNPGSTAIRYLANSVIITVNGSYGFLPNQKISFRSSGNAGVLVDTIYYVINISSLQTFQISLTPSGLPVQFTTGGSDGNLVTIPIDSQVTGPGSPLTTAIPVSFTGNKVILASHQLLANDIVSFPIVTNNLVTYTPYYITGTVNSGDFQIAANTGGTPLTFSDGTGTMLYDSAVVGISGTLPTITVTMSRPMTATTTANSMFFRPLKTSIALMKNWTVTG